MRPASPAGFLTALAAAVGVEGYERAPGELGADAERIAGVLKPGLDGDRLGAGKPTAPWSTCAAKLDAKLLEVPDGANARGLREVGCLPDAGPGLSEAPDGRNAAEIRDALAAGDLEAAFLVNADPVRDFPEGRRGARRSARRSSSSRSRCSRTPRPGTPTSSSRPSPTPRRRARSPIRTAACSACGPGCRIRGSVRPMWQVLVELSALLGDETGIDSAPEALAAIASEVPFYAGITHEEIGGRGVRWQDRDAASAVPAKTAPGLGTSPVQR